MADLNPRVHFVDCTPKLLTSLGNINGQLMEDAGTGLPSKRTALRALRSIYLDRNVWHSL